jgi:hypothetical protein
MHMNEELSNHNISLLVPCPAEPVANKLNHPQTQSTVAPEVQSRMVIVKTYIFHRYY